jgi:hypothetical protein
MGNMQFNLEKEYDVVLVKDITIASSVIDTIKNVEEKVSFIRLKCYFYIVLIGFR